MGMITSLKNNHLSVILKLLLSIILFPMQYSLISAGFAGSLPLVILLYSIGLPAVLSFFISVYLVGSIPFIQSYMFPIVFLSTVIMNYFLITILYRIWRRLFARRSSV